MELKIGAKIRRLRAANNLTQEELALRADLTKGFISLIERDETSISLDSLGALLEVFGITFADFFTMEAEETEERVVFTRDERVEITGKSFHSLRHSAATSKYKKANKEDLARKLAEIKNIDIEDVATQTTNNAIKLFKLPAAEA